MIVNFFLFFSLFYYVGRGLNSQIFTGKIVYPFLILVALLALLKKALVTGKLISQQINLLCLAIFVILFMLYSYTIFHADLSRISDNVSTYFGVAVFFLLFYSLQSIERFNPLKIIRAFIIILSFEAIIEILMVDFLGMTRFLIHYDMLVRLVTTSDQLYYGIVQGISGLLANKSNTSSFFVALFWLYQGFKKNKNWKRDPILLLSFLGFIACLSGTAFTSLLITTIIYRKRNLIWIGLFIIPTIWLIQEKVSYVSKVTITYFLMSLDHKWNLFLEYFNLIKEHPLVLLFGTSTLYFEHQGPSDTTILKLITDIGLTPIFLYFYLIWLFLKNCQQIGMSPSSITCLKLAMLSLVLGTMHYPVIFSVPVQAFLGALFAWSLHTRYSDKPSTVSIRIATSSAPI